MEDLTGRQFGPYQIIAPLGEGGMAAVYKAYQPAMERYVALKILPRTFADNPLFIARFKREAKLLAQLQHPHILPVFDYGQAEGYTYLVMPFVQSGTLTDSLTGKPLPLQRIRQVVTQIGEALSYAHARGLIHRDVKPSNVLIDESGNCLLADFGLAHVTEDSVNLTSSGTILGTPAYMSPEQGSGQKVDARSDLYSLGIIFYEMATGRVPYRAETPIAVIFKHIQDPLPPSRTLNPELPEAVELAIQKALAKSPQDRYQSADELIEALESAIPNAPAVSNQHQGAKTQIQPLTGKPKPQEAGRWVWGALGLVTLCLILIAAPLAVFGFGSKLMNQEQTNTPIVPPSEVIPTQEFPIQPTNELVPDWEAIGGSWTGPDNDGLIYGRTASFDGDALYLFKEKYSDFTFAANVQALTREASLAIRMSDDGKNGYLIIFIPRGSEGGNPGLFLAKRVQGDHTFSEFFAADYARGEWVQLLVEAKGTQILVSLNGNQVIEYNDADNPFITGRLGFRCYGEPTAPCEANFSDLYLAH
ncbi:MAG: protein kinase [Anaerolineales bacterium]|nr:protein kinase [Anaerolineales bacterium]